MSTSFLARTFTLTGKASDTFLSSPRPFTITQRDKVPWADESHHSHSWLTRNRNGFLNPWKSFHKPTVLELAAGATFARIEEGAHVVDERDPKEVEDESLDLIKPPSWGGASSPPNRKEQSQLRATWLGHAGVLVHFEPQSEEETAFNVLVDPIFSMRASPSQNAGPTRIVESPCTVADLPPINAVLVSHNHYDHMDLATLADIYNKEKENVQFFVPLGNANFITSTGIPEAQVTECDWWQEHDLAYSVPARTYRITCTPAQHNSGRYGLDANNSLWSGWFVQRVREGEGSASDLRVYYAGDTGLRYRDPQKTYTKWETCPVFEDIARHLGTPDLAILPISVGGTLPYVKSWDPTPAGYSIVPEIPEALTSSTHMSPGDAVDMHRLLLGELAAEDITEDAQDSIEDKNHDATTTAAPLKPKPDAEVFPGRKRMITLAVHFGTFCSGPAESRDTVRTLRKECAEKGVEFLKLRGPENGVGPSSAQGSAFMVLDHGGTVKIVV